MRQSSPTSASAQALSPPLQGETTAFLPEAESPVEVARQAMNKLSSELEASKDIEILRLLIPEFPFDSKKSDEALLKKLVNCRTLQQKAEEFASSDQSLTEQVARGNQQLSALNEAVFAKRKLLKLGNQMHKAMYELAEQYHEFLANIQGQYRLEELWALAQKVKQHCKQMEELQAAYRKEQSQLSDNALVILGFHQLARNLLSDVMLALLYDFGIQKIDSTDSKCSQWIECYFRHAESAVLSSLYINNFCPVNRKHIIELHSMLLNNYLRFRLEVNPAVRDLFSRQFQNEETAKAHQVIAKVLNQFSMNQFKDSHWSILNKILIIALKGNDLEWLADIAIFRCFYLQKTANERLGKIQRVSDFYQPQLIEFFKEMLSVLDESIEHIAPLFEMTEYYPAIVEIMTCAHLAIEYFKLLLDKKKGLSGNMRLNYLKQLCTACDHLLRLLDYQEQHDIQIIPKFNTFTFLGEKNGASITFSCNVNPKDTLTVKNATLAMLENYIQKRDALQVERAQAGENSVQAQKAKSPDTSQSINWERLLAELNQTNRCAVAQQARSAKSTDVKQKQQAQAQAQAQSNEAIAQKARALKAALQNAEREKAERKEAEREERKALERQFNQGEPLRETDTDFTLVEKLNPQQISRRIKQQLQKIFEEPGRKDTEVVEALLNKLTQIPGNDVWFHYFKGQQYYAQRKWEAACEHFQSALMQADRQSDAISSEYPKLKSNILYGKIRSDIHREHFPDALVSLNLLEEYEGESLSYLLLLLNYVEALSNPDKIISVVLKIMRKPELSLNRKIMLARKLLKHGVLSPTQMTLSTLLEGLEQSQLEGETATTKKVVTVPHHPMHQQSLLLNEVKQLLIECKLINSENTGVYVALSQKEIALCKDSFVLVKYGRQTIEAFAKAHAQPDTQANLHPVEALKAIRYCLRNRQALDFARQLCQTFPFSEDYQHKVTVLNLRLQDLLTTKSLSDHWVANLKKIINEISADEHDLLAYYMTVCIQHNNAELAGEIVDMQLKRRPYSRNGIYAFLYALRTQPRNATVSALIQRLQAHAESTFTEDPSTIDHIKAVAAGQKYVRQSHLLDERSDQPRLASPSLGSTASDPSTSSTAQQTHFSEARPSKNPALTAVLLQLLKKLHHAAVGYGSTVGAGRFSPNDIDLLVFGKTADEVQALLGPEVSWLHPVTFPGFVNQYTAIWTDPSNPEVTISLDIKLIEEVHVVTDAGLDRVMEDFFQRSLGLMLEASYGFLSSDGTLKIRHLFNANIHHDQQLIDTVDDPKTVFEKNPSLICRVFKYLAQGYQLSDRLLSEMTKLSSVQFRQHMGRMMSHLTKQLMKGEGKKYFQLFNQYHFIETVMPTFSEVFGNEDCKKWLVSQFAERDQCLQLAAQENPAEKLSDFGPDLLWVETERLDPKIVLYATLLAPKILLGPALTGLALRLQTAGMDSRIQAAVQEIVTLFVTEYPGSVAPHQIEHLPSVILAIVEKPCFQQLAGRCQQVAPPLATMGMFSGSVRCGSAGAQVDVPVIAKAAKQFL